MNKWLHGLIREIPQSSFNTGVEAAVARDTDNDQALCFKLYNSKGDIEFGYHFNINWIEKDEKRVDWLAHAVGRALQNAYNKGKRDSKASTAHALSGLKKLLNQA